MQDDQASGLAITLNTEQAATEILPQHVEVAAREIYTALSTFLRHATIIGPVDGGSLPWVSEIRIPAVLETNHKTGKVYTNVEAAWFDLGGIEDIAAMLASKWCQPPEQLGPYEKYASGGIYWTINPVSPGHLANYGSVLERKKGTTSDTDTVARYWLPIDADATRRDPVTGASIRTVSSTDLEKAKIASLVEQVRDYLVGDLQWPEPVQVDTGNGFADYYALPGLPIPRCPDPKNPGCLKYDEASDTLVRDVIHALARKFKGELGSIDPSVFNPSRIMEIPGTWARKARSTPDRPHRASKILYIPPNIEPISLEQLRLALDSPRAKTVATPAADHGTPPGNGDPVKPLGPAEPRTEDERSQRVRRARLYLTKVPGAISGQNGHGTAFTGIGKVIRRFALTREMALEAIVDWNNRCEPPWSDTELAHKLDNIYADEHSADDWGSALRNRAIPDRAQSIPDEAQSIAANLGSIPLTRSYNYTDYGNGERLAHKFGHQLHYCYPWKKWLHWDGTRWNPDNIGVMPAIAKSTIRAIYKEEIDIIDQEAWSALRNWAIKSEDAKHLAAMVTVAQSEPNIPILPETMDTNPWLLNCLNYTLDLSLDAQCLTLAHNQADLITKLAPVNYDKTATYPNWIDTLNLVFNGDLALIAYFQQLCGIALTGIVTEQIVPILYGTGSNGKSTIINTMLGLLGTDYAIKLPQNFLMTRTHESHPTELADLHGKRLVAAIETGEGLSINEVRLKELSGGDRIRA